MFHSTRSGNPLENVHKMCLDRGSQRERVCMLLSSFQSPGKQGEGVFLPCRHVNITTTTTRLLGLLLTARPTTSTSTLQVLLLQIVVLGIMPRVCTTFTI